MRRLVAIAALVALGAAFAVQVFAQQPVNPLWYDASTGKSTTIQSGSLSLPIQEQFPERSMRLLEPAAIQATFWRRLISAAQQTSFGYRTQDSSRFINTTGYRMLGILVYPTYQDSAAGAGATMGAVFHFQVRFSTASVSDSSNMMLVGSKSKALTGTAIDYTKPDSLGSFFDMTGNNGSALGARDSATTSDMQVLVLTAAANNQRGRLYYLTNRDGTPIRGDNVQLWLRIHHSICGGPCYYCEQSTLTDAANAGARRVRLRVDLVGWM